MSLATRLSGFFLAALFVVLAGFSVPLYLLAGAHFQRDTDEWLTLGLDSLLGSVSVDSDEVEWRPGARPTILGEHPQDDPVRWAVYDDRGRVVDRCWELGPDDLSRIGAMAPDVGHVHARFIDSKGEVWRLVVRRVSAGNVSDEESEHSRGGASDPAAMARSRRAPSMVLAAGTSAAPTEAGLRNVARTLLGVSIGIWLLAMVVGRWLVRGALRPVTRMAEAAGSMTAADRDHRLPIPGTGDELDALAGSFNGLLERLHEEVGRQKRFTGDASHQLRTPLTALLGQVEVALRRDRPAEDYRRTLADVHEEAVRLRQIVDSLLFLARAESEAGRPDLQPLEIAPFVCAHLGNWSDHDRAGDLHVDLEPGRNAWVHAHPPLLGQLLDNLLDNAAKYSAPGTPIEVRVWRAGDHVALAVRDHGMGLSAEDPAHLFEPFYRSAEARRRGYPGVGLGLAVVRRIAAAFGGTIEVQSEPGRGSTFTLRLPVASDPAVGAKCPPSAEPMPLARG
jgi:two-component system, OmpR family, sensor kinase